MLIVHLPEEKIWLQEKLDLVGQWLGRMHFGHAFGTVTMPTQWWNACSISFLLMRKRRDLMVEVSIPTYSMLILHFRSMEILGISLPLPSCDLVDPSLAQTIHLHALFLSLIMEGINVSFSDLAQLRQFYERANWYNNLMSCLSGESRSNFHWRPVFFSFWDHSIRSPFQGIQSKSNLSIPT